MQRLADENPQIVHLIDIGRNDQSTPIFGLRIEGPSKVSAATKAKHLVVATHHGNEQLSAEVAMSFARQLISTLQNPAAPRHVGLTTSVFFVIPVLNISGYNAGRREERAQTGTFLGPNRDYPIPAQTTHPFG